LILIALFQLGGMLATAFKAFDHRWERQNR
jgi:hypothetical protein